MGIKKLFKIKPPEDDTPEQNRDTLMELGITTKNSTRKKREKFAAYGKFAKDKGQDKVFAPAGYEEYATPQDEEDLNKSELDTETKTAPQQTNGHSDPYSIPSGASDPYAVKQSVGYGDDPYASFQSGINDQRPGYSSNEFAAQRNARDPYNASKNYSSAYDGLSSYNNNASENAGSPYASGGNLNSYNGNNARRSSPMNQYGADRGERPNPQSEVSFNNVTTGNMPKNASYGNNSYGDNEGRGNPYAGSGSLSYQSASNSASTMSSNPYAAISSDSYAGGMNSNPYSSRTPNGSGSVAGAAAGASAGYGATAVAPVRRARGPRGLNSNRLAPVPSVAGTLDLNKSNLDSEDLNQEPRAGEFDFENEVTDQVPNNTVGVDELDLNATINGDDRGADGVDDFNAPYADQQQQQQTLEQEPQWQMEEEEHGAAMQQYQQEQQQHGYDGMNNDRGYRTFEEIQREEEARQQQEEDEAVDEIKQDIRFTKQSSMASTRNTLKMAQEAEMAGMNTLGLLGHQSEKLNNVERNLDLLRVQNTIADDKVAELKKLNRSLLAVHVSNPFNSKRRQREREEKIKNRKIEEKLMQEHTSKELARSTQRIEGAMAGNDEISTVREKYQRQQILDRSKKFQFENDEEDDMMEIEIDRNLDQIQQISGRLKKLAVATGEELNSQQGRVRNIEDDTDDLDIKIHLNTTRLSGIR